MDFITAKKGSAHFTSEHFRTVLAAISGGGSYVASLYEQLDAELITNNLIRIKSGYLLHHGGVFLIDEGTYDEVTIQNGSQGLKRIDLIVARYSKDANTGIESGSLAVIQGTAAASNPTVPAYNQGNMQDGSLIDDCTLFEVHLNGIEVATINKLVDVLPNMELLKKLIDGSVNFKRVLTSEDDLNEMKENGIYVYSTSSIPINCPYANAGIVEVIHADSDSTRIIQRVTRYGVDGETTFRTLYENNWNKWTSHALKSDAYFKSGDSVTVSVFTSGYVTSGGASIYFILPVSKCIPNGTIITATTGNGFILRQNGKYTHGSSSDAKAIPSSYSAWYIDTNAIQIKATFDDTTNATNNDTIGIVWEGTITFS